MTETPDKRRLFREAADLAIRLQNDPGNSVSIEMARNWIARSPEHAAAWARVAEIHGMAGKILSERQASDDEGKLSRRNLLAGGAMAVGAVAAGSWAVPRAVLLAKADHVTSTAEIEQVALPDGSTMTLGPDSAAAIDFTETARRIDLFSGMAYFDVLRDRQRPFSVRTGPMTATALGTAFDVSNDAGFVSVSVESGNVEARSPDSDLAWGEQLKPGDWLTYDPSAGGLTRGTRAEGQIASWRSGMIVAEKETVSALVAKISRWQRGSVVIADPYLGSRVASGVFDLRDPVRALEAVVRPFGAKVHRLGGFVTVIAPV